MTRRSMAIVALAAVALFAVVDFVDAQSPALSRIGFLDMDSAMQSARASEFEEGLR